MLHRGLRHRVDLHWFESSQDGLSEFDIHANTIMECPSGFFTDLAVGCARCLAGEKPDSAQLGCRKCTDRVTASQQTWVSLDGGECTLCPARQFPNDMRSDCMVCLPRQWNNGNGAACTPCIGMSEPTRDQSAVRPTRFLSSHLRHSSFITKLTT